MIVRDVVGKKNFLSATTAHVQGGKIIQGSRCSNARKQPAILLVPNAVALRGICLLGFADGGSALNGLRVFLFRGFLRRSCFRRKTRRRKQQAGQFEFLQVHSSRGCGPTLRACLLSQLLRSFRSRKLFSSRCCRIRNALPQGIVILFRPRSVENRSTPVSKESPMPHSLVFRSVFVATLAAAFV